jgi:predicted nucleotidyltransferase
MNTKEISLLPNHRATMERFVAACVADERVVAAFLGGSYARGMADAHSDLDLYVVTTDHAFEDFCNTRAVFIRQLGEPLFLEDFERDDLIFFIFPNDTEGELCIGRIGAFIQIHSGPYRVLLDKNGILEDAMFPPHEADPIEQRAKLRQLIDWFWHEFSHFVTAMQRNQLWWAHGQVEVMRLQCVNLARLRYNFADPYVSDEYFKVELALPVAQIAVLETTYCPLEKAAMLQAVCVILDFYRDVAPSLAQAHDLVYSTELERIMVARLERLRQE